ncbi:aminotransferase class IV [Croceivirga sp. JEA036]|uniref:aminotransferase class IV n=1 Tax=Croceivirga sp. JEA036 TaxID=2721162 RepID=UPI00143CAFE3|nr:aminotransferase class IV [Croceivirga sp. JEA036]NJB35435.1 aminotransferase class IV [Croceivirga sp. JEA036]
MVNFNGTIVPADETLFTANHRAFLYGDALFEEVRLVNGKLSFWEEHYFRLMANMRMLRMQIPMSFTMEFLEEEILKTLDDKETSTYLIRISVARKGDNALKATTNRVDYTITAKVLTDAFYTLSECDFEVELFKDHYVNADLLSTIKTTNQLLPVVASVFAEENGYDDCLLVNQNKQVISGTEGNLFVVKGTHIKTAPLADGCFNTVIRKKLIEMIGALPEFELEEASISPFELQKADELFLLTEVSGVQAITKYRKKIFTNKIASALQGKLNAHVRMASLK